MTDGWSNLVLKATAGHLIIGFNAVQGIISSKCSKVPIRMEVPSPGPEGDVKQDHVRMICHGIYRIRRPLIFSMIVFWSVCIVCTVTNKLSTVV